MAQNKVHLYISLFEFQELYCINLQKHILDAAKHLRLIFFARIVDVFKSMFLLSSPE